MKTTTRAFTLIEILLALFAGAIILAAIYGFFSKAVHMRQDAVNRAHDTRVRARAAATLRNDLRGAIVTGGLLGSTLDGSARAPSSNFPGYLKFATTTASFVGDEIGGDVQQVEYYVANNTGPNADGKSGTLVRTLNRDPLATLQTDPPLEPLLDGVTGMDILFWDGTEWTSTWEYDPTDAPTLPEAVKVVVHVPAPAAPIEVEVTWDTQPEVEASPSPTPAS